MTSHQSPEPLIPMPRDSSRKPVPTHRDRREIFTSGHPAMRNPIPMVFIAVTLLVGCHSPALVSTQPTAPAPLPFHPLLLTNFCTQTSLDGTWRMGISETNVAVSRFPGLTGAGWPARSQAGESTVSIPSTAHTGWFVFAENDCRVWYYDGDQLLWRFTFSETWNKERWSSGDYSAGPFFGDQSTPVPAEVFVRLSEPARKMVRNHG